ncbi:MULTISPECIES: DUF2960 domain-containing protein [Photobacterium]|uniref:DUF2960 domain-containing protein n=2 Tax=Photobacterium leiognathi TaxID=553611 RepID=A0A2T3MEH4_PHOLE|nr:MULTISPECIES: DUF2960 domain-containing protein [Photobacterium]MBP2699568.1 DUF2960 domain-containing protein [Vibrio parahaemolyticus]KJF89599.1 hypothetical protein UB42_12055 [Photobacterium leiognathi]KJF98362.1 hypothetical protein UB34_08045 [Photobacterium leiognathi]KPA51948.1 hypothetical protein VT25_17865 [Photobacterium leiognathi subsp. mandapamensis]MCG3886127.1 DUF2960 domain-containing protein [Photobacterium leiognathi]
MSRTIIYTYKKEEKEIIFSFDQFRNIHEAVAAAEGIDLTSFLKMEQQVEAVSNSSKAARDFRDSHFRKLGFGKIALAKKENRGVGQK